MRFTRTGAGALLSALLVTTAAASPAVAAPSPSPVPRDSKSCSVDGFKGSAEFTVERVGDRIVTKVSGQK